MPPDGDVAGLGLPVFHAEPGGTGSAGPTTSAAIRERWEGGHPRKVRHFFVLAWRRTRSGTSKISGKNFER